MCNFVAFCSVFDDCCSDFKKFNVSEMAGEYKIMSVRCLANIRSCQLDAWRI